MTETTKAPSKQALEAARSIFERVRSCSTYEGWVCDDETETEAIAAALDDFAEAQSEGLLKARERAIAERDALRERNRALVEALQVIFRRGYHGASYVAQLALAADAKAGDVEGRRNG